MPNRELMNYLTGAEVRAHDGPMPAHPDDEPTGKLLFSKRLTSAEAEQLARRASTPDNTGTNA